MKIVPRNCSWEKYSPYSSKTEILFSRHSHVSGGESSLEQSFGVNTNAAATISAPLRALAAAARPGSGVSRLVLARIRCLLVFAVSLHVCLHGLNALVERRCVLLRC